MGRSILLFALLLTGVNASANWNWTVPLGLDSQGMIL